MSALSYDDAMTRANALAAAGQAQAAFAEFVRVCEAFPEAGNPAFRAGEMLAQMGLYEAALPHFERAVRLVPDWLDAREVHGRALWCARRAFDAERVWRDWRRAQAAAAWARHEDPARYRLLDSTWVRWLGNNAHLDCYVKMALLGWRPCTRVKVLAPAGAVANPAYLDLWRPYVDIVSDSAEVARLSAQLPTLGDSLFTMVINGTPTYYTNAIAVVQAEWERQGRAPLLSLDPQWVARGRARLRELGVPEGAWFVGLHVREAGFHKEREDPTNRPRVADIDTYLPAVEQVVERGGYVVRLGDPSMRPLPPLRGVVDYALSAAKADWMDVFLVACSRFMINTNSALYQACASFGTASVATNWTPLSAFPMFGGDIVLPKLLRCEVSGRVQSFDDSLTLPRDAPFGGVYAQRGLAVVDNTAQDILEATVEMLDRLAGRTVPDPADAARQARFRRMAAAHRVVVNSRLGAGFLARQQALL